MNLLVSEILDKAEQAKTRQEKINILRENNSDVFRCLLRLNFDPGFSMNLPEGSPPYKKEVDKPIGYNESSLIKEYRRFYIWLTPQPSLSQIKKETLFVGLLEGLHWTEAEIMIQVKDKILQKKYKSITEDLVREAFPKTLPPPVTTTKKVASPLV
jgi:hypothetical protein